MYQFLIGFITGAFVAQNYNIPNIKKLKNEIIEFLENNEKKKS